METMETLRDAFIDELKDIYSAEQQLVKALPDIEKKAANSSLKEALRSHLQETKTQVKRLEQAAEILGEKLSGKTCEAMKGLVEEGKEAIKIKSENLAIVDSVIIGAAQRVEHYEIAAYGTARAMAEELGESEIAKLLQETLEEESAADEKLSEISLNEVLSDANMEA